MKRIIRIVKTILIFTLILVLTSCSSALTSKAVAEPTKESVDMFMEAITLIDSIKYHDARKLLEDKYNIIKDYDMGLNTYGSMEFHIYKNYSKAEELFKKAIELNPENPSHYSGMACVYEAKGQYKKAIQYYEKAAKHISAYENVPINPKLAIVYKDIGECYLKLNDRKKAVEALEKASENNPYSIGANAILHKLYIELEEYEKAYKVWKNDNLIDDSGDHVYKGMLEWNRLYKDTIEKKDDITHLQRAGIFETLILYDEAAAEYKKASEQDQMNEDIKNKLYEMESYLSFRDELQALLDDYYRQRCINGAKEETTFYKRIKPAYEKIAPLFPQVGHSSGIASRWIDKLNDEIEKRFSVRIENIEANGSMLGLHFARIIDGSIIHSALWGEEIDLKVITLKNMTSNGLDYWRSMENGGVGGWSLSKTEVVRVIQDNENDSKLQLASFYNEDVREDFIKEMGIIKSDKEEREPLELYYSSDIQIQLITKQISTEAEKASDLSITDNELQGYLFDKIEKDFTVKTGIIVHESQHSIDNATGLNTKWLGEVEYRSKISQLAYGSMPFLTLNQCYNPSIGMENDNTHTRANTQFFKDIVQYIHDNHDKFPQIDINENILAQLTKLSEDDLKAIAIDIFEGSYPDEKYM